MKLVKAKNYTPSNRTQIDLVVIHTAECGETPNAAENVAAYFAGPQAPKASAHYTVDVDSIVQSVEEKDIAWHAGPANGYSIGIEHAGYAKQTEAEWSDPYSQEMLRRSAELVADICWRYQIPVRRVSVDDLKAGGTKRRGLCGHIDVTNALTGGKGHWDPGPKFPWDAYLARVSMLVALKALEATDEADGGTCGWVEVEHQGQKWQVAPVYLAPVGIGQALELARLNGCELPSPELVDAIWEKADLKLSPLPRKHDGTPRTMASDEVFADQNRKIDEQIAGRQFTLLAGTHKDVVLKDGKIGLYGWHRPDGSVIQPFYSGHAPAWIDYSQGLRLCRKV
jgi:N-acetyl-anhydromuramyl-L-alanine amidase AmpD